jgi:hypothetical protein
MGLLTLLLATVLYFLVILASASRSASIPVQVDVSRFANSPVFWAVLLLSFAGAFGWSFYRQRRRRRY